MLPKKIISVILTVLLLASNIFAQNAALSLKDYQTRTNKDLAAISRVAGVDAKTLFSNSNNNFYAGLLTLVVATGAKEAAGQAAKVQPQTLDDVIVKMEKSFAGKNPLIVKERLAVLSLKKIIDEPQLKKEFYDILVGGYTNVDARKRDLFNRIVALQQHSPAFDKEIIALASAARTGVAKEELYYAVMHHTGAHHSRKKLRYNAFVSPMEEIHLVIESFELERNINIPRYPDPKADKVWFELETLHKNIKDYFEPVTGEMSTEYYVLKEKIYKKVQAASPEVDLVKNIEEQISRSSYKKTYNSSRYELTKLLKRVANLEKRTDLSASALALHVKAQIKQAAIKDADAIFIPKSLRRFFLFSAFMLGGAALAEAGAANSGRMSRLYKNIALLDTAGQSDLQAASGDPVLAEAYAVRADIIAAVAQGSREEIKAFAELSAQNAAAESKNLDLQQFASRPRPDLSKYNFKP